MIGSESEEKLIQKAREAEVQPLPGLLRVEPTEAETIHQRRYFFTLFRLVLIAQLLILVQVDGCFCQEYSAC